MNKSFKLFSKRCLQSLETFLKSFSLSWAVFSRLSHFLLFHILFVNLIKIFHLKSLLSFWLHKFSYKFSETFSILMLENIQKAIFFPINDKILQTNTKNFPYCNIFPVFFYVKLHLLTSFRAHFSFVTQPFKGSFNILHLCTLFSFVHQRFWIFIFDDPFLFCIFFLFFFAVS